MIGRLRHPHCMVSQLRIDYRRFNCVSPYEKVELELRFVPGRACHPVGPMRRRLDVITRDCEVSRLLASRWIPGTTPCLARAGLGARLSRRSAVSQLGGCLVPAHHGSSLPSNVNRSGNIHLADTSMLSESLMGLCSIYCHLQDCYSVYEDDVWAIIAFMRSVRHIESTVHTSIGHATHQRLITTSQLRD